MSSKAIGVAISGVVTLCLHVKKESNGTFELGRNIITLLS